MGTIGQPWRPSTPSVPLCGLIVGEAPYYKKCIAMNPLIDATSWGSFRCRPFS